MTHADRFLWENQKMRACLSALGQMVNSTLRLGSIIRNDLLDVSYKELFSKISIKINSHEYYEFLEILYSFYKEGVFASPNSPMIGIAL